MVLLFALYIGALGKEWCSLTGGDAEPNARIPPSRVVPGVPAFNRCKTGYAGGYMLQCPEQGPVYRPHTAEGSCEWIIAAKAPVSKGSEGEGTTFINLQRASKIKLVVPASSKTKYEALTKIRFSSPADTTGFRDFKIKNVDNRSVWKIDFKDDAADQLLLVGHPQEGGFMLNSDKVGVSEKMREIEFEPAEEATSFEAGKYRIQIENNHDDAHVLTYAPNCPWDHKKTLQADPAMAAPAICKCGDYGNFWCEKDDYCWPVGDTANDRCQIMKGKNLVKKKVPVEKKSKSFMSWKKKN